MSRFLDRCVGHARSVDTVAPSMCSCARTWGDQRVRLSIADAGAGFPVDGHRSQRELEESEVESAVIMDRAREFGGDISVISRPGKGARLELDVPVAG